MFGLVLDSSTVAHVETSLSGASDSVVLHVITPTVPAPTLVDGRPQ